MHQENEFIPLYRIIARLTIKTGKKLFYIFHWSFEFLITMSKNELN